ncbi:hypothetical protein EJ08DRAFT_738721 [Tothia fuscella]|uniref:C2H2-type domain-containing protein n=1 Tax=Tothia fuscella TaxID=1048955 RepID=A0A9P4TSG1_9PEZI|nr:hypothetical protein EJ08DRAFT_738721 [Tothia fuscella]
MEAIPPRKRDRGSESEEASKRTRIEQPHVTDNFNDSGNESVSTPQGDTNLDDNRFVLRPNIYTCTIADCGRTFNRPCRLTEHERSHTGERPYSCGQCDKTFLRDYHLARHKKTSHDGIKDHKCTYDGCDRAFATAQKLREHINSHEKKKGLTCTGYDGCSESFRKKSALHAHVAVAHLNQKPYPCTEADLFTGELCRRGYETESKLRAHILKAHQGERYVCSICSSATHTDSGISMPTSMSVDNASEIMDDASEYNPGTPASTVYPFPSYVFSTYNLLQSHIAKTHPPTCPHCHSPCASKRDLARHIELLHPDAAGPVLSTTSAMPPPAYPCTVEGCGRVFTKSGNLKVHVQTVHENQKNFVCGRTNLSNSSKMVYDDGREIKWDAGKEGCGKGFGTKAMLENHVRTQHLGLEDWNKVTKRRRNAASSSGMGDDISSVFSSNLSEPISKPKGRKPQPTASSLLTGLGYENSGRKIKCLNPACPRLFYREYDLRVHCASTHGLAQLEVEDALKERAAVEGGVFWYGGIDPVAEREFAALGGDDDGFEESGFDGRSVVPVDPQLEGAGMRVRFGGMGMSMAMVESFVNGTFPAGDVTGSGGGEDVEMSESGF